MFDYIRGTLAGSTPQTATLDVNGLGYLLFIPLSTYEALPQVGSELMLFVSAVIREDSHRLFGFMRREERACFEMLNEISGIGPRVSIALLGHMSMDQLYLAIEHADTKAITQVPGIGKKMAERLVLELKDKPHSKENISLSKPTAPKGIVSDAISALINLGYSSSDAQKAVESALPSGEEPPLPELISLALARR